MVAAAVLTDVGAPLDVWTDIEVDAPGPREVMVDLVASGICHTDLLAARGAIPAGELPVVLGHEGAGTVVAVGSEVRTVAPGDHVVISWVPQCGECFYCRRGQPQLCAPGGTASTAGTMLDGTNRLSRGGVRLRQMCAVGTFSERSVVPEASVVKIADDIDLGNAALIGCAVLTGVGAALNTASVSDGDVVVVLGCGGVGLNVVQGARIAGAGTIVAIDVDDASLTRATRFGATHTVNAGREPARDVVRSLTGGHGADVVFEVVGKPETIDAAVRMARRGGQAIIIGVPHHDTRLSVRVLTGVLAAEKTIKGSWYGSSDVRRDVPKLVDLYRRGELVLDELITRRIGLADVGPALADLEQGHAGRTLIEYRANNANDARAGISGGHGHG